MFEAAAQLQKVGIGVKPEVMIPLVGFKAELDLQVELVHRVAKEVVAEKKAKLSYLVGTIIEVPRGALTAEFLGFGTNVTPPRGNELTSATKSVNRSGEERPQDAAQI